MSEDKLRLYYTWRDDDKGDSLIGDDLREQWLRELSPEKKVAVSRRLHKTDQDSSLVGLQLVKYCAQDMQVAGFDLSDIEYPEAGKPFWQDATLSENKEVSSFDFNISHSDNLIMVVASTSMRVGVDVEKIRPLKNLNFKSVMLEHELAQIKKQPEQFFKLWSIKEAVVKAADTAGLSRMLDVKIDERKYATIADDRRSFSVEFEAQSWQIKQWHMDDSVQNKKFSAAVATSQLLDELKPEFINLEALQ